MMIEGDDDDQNASEVVVEVGQEPDKTVEVNPGSTDDIASLKAAVDEANRQAETHRRDLEASQQREAEARRQVESTIDDRVSAREIALDNAMAAYEQQKANLRQAKLAARQTGDFAREAEIDENLADILYQSRKARDQKEALSNWKATEVAKVEAITRQQAELAERVKADPLSVFDAPTRRWMEAHPDSQPGKGRWQKTLAADQDAQAEGYKPGTAEYFGYVDRFLGYVQDDSVTVDPNPAPRQAAANKPRPQVAAAPPSRGNGDGRPKERQVVRLTRNEQEVAEMSFDGATPQEKWAKYAREKQKLQAEGRM